MMKRWGDGDEGVAGDVCKKGNGDDAMGRRDEEGRKRCIKRKTYRRD